jgi:hypothetical protein
MSWYRVSCIPDFPPSTAEEKAARATFEAILDKQEKGGLIEMVSNILWSCNTSSQCLMVTSYAVLPPKPGNYDLAVG